MTSDDELMELAEQAIKPKHGETYSTEGPQCPFCERQYTADEPFYFDENLDEMDCDDCGQKFKVEVYHSVSWTCEPFPDDE